jgi:hypothetical protein
VTPRSPTRARALSPWFSIASQVCNPKGIHFCVAAALMLLLATVARAQNSQFFFDPNGNLHAESAAVRAPPQILAQPQNRIVQPGEATSFLVVAADTRALT